MLQQYAAVPLVENKVPVGARRINLFGGSGKNDIDKLIENVSSLYTLQNKGSLFDCLC